MDHGAGSCGVRVHRVHRRVTEESPHQHIHGVVQGRGEQHSLALRRGGLQQPPHHRQKAKIGHVVGLIEHADLHIAQVAVPLLDEIRQPPRACHHDVHPPMQRRYLGVLPGAAEDRGDGQAHGPCQRQDHRVDLAGQLPGGHQDQTARAAGAGMTVGQPDGERDREPERLAGTSPAAAQDVHPGQGIRQHSGLDWKRDGDAGVRQLGHQRARDAQLSECHVHRGQAGHIVGGGDCGYAVVLRLRLARGL